MAYGNYPTYMHPYQQVYTGLQAPVQQPNSEMMRMVASKEEVIAAQIPFDGNEYFFKDTSSGKVYSKQFNPANGTAPVSTYVKDIEKPIQYATLDDLTALRDEILGGIKSE